jgi:hypothetical protein
VLVVVARVRPALLMTLILPARRRASSRAAARDWCQAAVTVETAERDSETAALHKLGYGTTAIAAMT